MLFRSKMYAPGHGISPRFAQVYNKRITDDHLRFVGVGRISRSKKVIETIQFFEKLLHKEPDAIFQWVGGPIDESGKAYLDEIQMYIQNQHLEKRVKLLGALPHKVLSKLFSTSDLLIHFSQTGSLDKVAPEAIISGCSVFSTNPALQEVLPEYYWSGALKDEAVHKALYMAKHGISVGEHERVTHLFSLDALVEKIANKLTA